jgi:radical SAM protein with 4Fe4S-binding SPASM domain
VIHPKVCIVNVSERCALRCVHCYLAAKEGARKEMSLEQADRLFGQLKGVKSRITGVEGDHSQIEKIVDIADRHGVRFSLSLSPLYLSEKMACDVADRVKGFTVSLDGGTPETNDRIRNCPGTFDKTIKILKFLQDNGLKHSVFCAVSNFNLNEVRLIVERIRGIANEVIFIYTSNFGRAVKEMTVSKDDWAALTGELEEIKKSDTGIRIVYEPIFCRKNKTEYPDYEPCSLYSKRMCFIDCEGNVYFCSLLAERNECMFSLGNIFKEDFSKIWAGSPKWEEFRKLNEEKTEKCNSCSALDKCSRGCFANTIVHGRQMPEGTCSSDTMPMCYMYWYGIFD